jgi:hypothetical protein
VAWRAAACKWCARIMAGGIAHCVNCGFRMVMRGTCWVVCRTGQPRVERSLPPACLKSRSHARQPLTCMTIALAVPLQAPPGTTLPAPGKVWQ